MKSLAIIVLCVAVAALCIVIADYSKKILTSVDKVLSALIAQNGLIESQSTDIAYLRAMKKNEMLRNFTPLPHCSTSDYMDAWGQFQKVVASNKREQAARNKAYHDQKRQQQQKTDHNGQLC